ncbi:MAG: lamin tail domain-containing protein, partial [Candidatus Thorarchaeota archaeon]|nr:lamin tail domain-containing protein [Candidatus Thorarchaeota archaeon]
MDSKRIAIIVIILIVSAGTIAAIYLFRPSNVIPITAEDTPSTYNGVAFISEVYYSDSIENEFVEMYIPSTYTEDSLPEWFITTFDDESLIRLPSILGIDGEDYIAVYTGTGTSDLDASDGKAEIYIGLNDSILAPTGDEIGLFDSNGSVIDFMRYSGGNGDDLFDDWPSSDDGPSSTSGSISLFGYDTGDSTNWGESIDTPGMPNIISYTTDSDYVFEVQSGLNAPYIDVGIDDEINDKDEAIEVSDEGGGVPLDTMLAIIDHLEFSLEYYLGKGFTRGPKTAANNTIKVVVVNGTSTETVGKASTSGTITIKVGTIESDTDLKYVCEHELMHLFQYQTEKEGNDTVDHCPVANKWWIEGQATYWGIESTKANFNLTNKEIQDEFDRVGDHNWYDDYLDLNRSIFIGWGKSYSDYVGSYLFMKFISEKYGEAKLKEVFDKAKDNLNNNSKDVSPEDAIAEVLGKTWEQILAEFYAWMMTDAITQNGVPERKGHVNVTYTNNSVSDEIKVGPYASGVERIKVNGTKPFSINFKLPQGGKWKITIIYVYEDGSRKQAFNTPFSIIDT